MTGHPLAEAATVERDKRRDSYPEKIRAQRASVGGDGPAARDFAEALAVDYQCWVAIAEWLETGRFMSFAGGADPDSPAAPVVRWPDLEAAAARALASANAKVAAMETDPHQERVAADNRIGPADYAWKLTDARVRRGRLFAIHRKVQLRRQTVDSINADLRGERLETAA